MDVQNTDATDGEDTTVRLTTLWDNHIYGNMFGYGLGCIDERNVNLSSILEI